MDSTLFEKSMELTDSFRVINHPCFKCGNDVAKTIVYDNEMDGWNNNFLLCHLCKKRDKFYGCHDSRVLVSDLRDFLTKRAMDNDEMSEAKGDNVDPLISDVSRSLEEPAHFSMEVINEEDDVQNKDGARVKTGEARNKTGEVGDKIERKGTEDEIEMDEVTVKSEETISERTWITSDSNGEQGSNCSRVNVEEKCIKGDGDFEKVDVPVVSPLSRRPPLEQKKLNVDGEQAGSTCLFKIGKGGKRFCMKCKKLVGNSVLSDHKVFCWKNSLYKCKLCKIEITYATRTCLGKHFRKSHKGMPMRYSIVGREEVQNGLIKVKERIFKCLKCLTLISSENRTSHELTCLRNMFIYCIHCKDELINFNSIRALRDHIKAYHKDVNYEYAKHNIENYCYQ